MEYLTEDLEPKKVLRYFEEICAIPHGTGNEAKLAQYIASLASDCGFEHETDAFGSYPCLTRSGKRSPVFDAGAYGHGLC